MTEWREAAAHHLRTEQETADLESPGPRRRRRIVAAITVVVGAATLTWALRIAPGDPLFYPATLALAAVWLAGSVAAGKPLRPHDGPTTPRPALLATGLVIGLVLLAVVLVGAGIVAQVPFLRTPVEQLLDHARSGSLPIVVVLTALNGVVEETFFRGALYDAFGGRRAILGSTVINTAVTALAGIPLLALAALTLGVTVAVLRRFTNSILTAIVAHLTWSIGMLLLLGPTLNLLERLL